MIEIESNSNPIELKILGQPTYDGQIRLFNKELKGKPVTMDLVKSYIEELKLTRSYSTVNLAKVALKKAIIQTFPESNDIRFRTMIDKMFLEIKTPKQDHSILSEKVLSQEDVHRLISETPKRISMMVEFLSVTGLRVSEMLNIKLANCRIEKEFVYITVLGKGSKIRRIFIPLLFFNDIKRTFKSDGYLFVTTQNNKYHRVYLTQKITYYGYKILNRSISAHTLRHSFATNEIKKRGSVAAVSKYLGHSTTAITEQMYNHDEIKPSDLF